MTRWGGGILLLMYELNTLKMFNAMVSTAGLKKYKTDSMIYKFYRNKFVPFQCIQTVGARQWVVYQVGIGQSAEADSVWFHRLLYHRPWIFM